MAAQCACADTGKLLLTGGVSSIDGAAGGGLTPWAVIGSNATERETGASVHVSRVGTQDYSLMAFGVTAGFNERVELSLARQDFDASPAVALNGIAAFGVRPGEHLRMDIVGLKLKLYGDVVLNSDTLAPQISVGLQHKTVAAGSLGLVFNFLGVKTSGTDLYVSATKLFLAKGLLVNGTLRYTNGNQTGLLGFGAGAPGEDARSLVTEFSMAFLLNPHVAIGVEYRFKPNNLEAFGRAAGLGDALAEDDWKDIFIAWAPNKNASLTLAYLDLGRIVPGVTAGRGQTGFYLSAQLAF